MAQYTTGEVAKLCGITVRTVQYWDERDLVRPSSLSEGGRRLYSDEDLSRLRIVCFLKELGFSLKDIRKLLEDPDQDKIIEILADEQLAYLKDQLAKQKEQLDRLHALKASLRTLRSMPQKSLGAIASVMDGRKKLRNLRITMTLVGLAMDVCVVGGILLWVFLGLWGWFIVGLALAIVMGVAITRYYMTHTAFICPTDHTIFRPSAAQMFFAYHTLTTRKLRCPHCDKKVSCVEIYVPDSEPTREGKYLIWPSRN